MATHTFKFKTMEHDMEGELDLSGVPKITMNQGMNEMLVVQLETFNKLLSNIDSIRTVFGEIDRISFVKITP